MAISPDELEISALAAVENAPDINTGYQWLAQEYQSAEWTNPKRASEILTRYGTTLRQKFDKNNIAGLGDVSGELPYSREELPDAAIEDPTDRQLEKENLWEQANLKYLDVTTDPNLLLKKDLLQEYIPAAASFQRRKIKDPGILKDTAARVALGVISPVTSLLGTGNPDFLTENTNPERDDDFMSELISGAGTVGTAIGLTAATGGAAGLGYLATGAFGSVKETYQSTKETTGSTERALAAGAVDAAGQTIGFALGGKVAGKIGAKFGQALTASTETLAKGGTQQAAKTAFRQIMETAGEQAAANVAMTQGRLSAQRVGLTGEAESAIPTSEDIAPDLRAAAVGGILGATAGALGQGYEALQQRSAARKQAALDVPPSESPPPVGAASEEVIVPPEERIISTPETRESALNDPNGITELALDESAASLPKIDSEGIAHAQEEQSVFRFPTTEEQSRSPEDSAQVVTTSNGDTIHVYENGEVTLTKASEGQLAPADKTFWTDPQFAAIVTALKAAKTPDGETPKLYTDGEDLFVKSDYVTQDLDISDVPTGSKFAKVPTKDGPSIGDVPIQATVPLAGGERTQYSSNVGPSITDIQPGPKVPIQPPEGLPKGEPRMVSQRIVDNKNLPQSVRDAFVTYDANGERTTSLRYIPESMVETGNLGLEWIAKTGGDMEALNAYLAGPDIVGKDVSAGAIELFRKLSRGVVEAEKAKDPIAAMQLGEFTRSIQTKLARAGTEGGQIVNYYKTLQSLEPETAVAFKVGELRGRILERELQREGVTPDDAARAPAEIQRIQEQIKEIQAAPEIEEPATEGRQLRRRLSQSQEQRVRRLQTEQEKLQKRINDRLTKVEDRLNKEFPPEMREKYRNLLEARRKFETDGPSTKAIEAELNTLERQLSKSRGEKILEGWRSFYILNLLADVGTGVATAVGNLANLGIGSANVVFGGKLGGRGGKVSDIPQNFQEFSRIALQSFPKAFRNAFEDFMGGYFQKYNEGDFVRTGPPIIRNLGYVGRFLSALDTFSTELGTDAATAIRLMETNPELRNLKGKELRAALNDALYGDASFRDAAKTEAQRQVGILKEVGIKGDEKVIMDDIFKRQRPEHVREEIEKWGLKVALRNDQGGTIGQVGKALSQLRLIPFAGPAFVNFVRAAGNLIAYKIELTPYGLLRPTLLEKVHKQHLTPLEKSQMYTSAIVGSVIAAGAYGLMASGKVQIHGNGPSNAAEKKRLQESGWKPFSFQIGDKFISYAEMPFSTILAGVGGYGDYLKYSVAKNKIGEKEAANYIMGAGFSSLFASPLTQNASELIEILKQGNEGGDIVGRLENFAKRNITEAGKNATIPGNRTLRNVTAMFQDPLETRLSWQAAVLNGLPYASKDGKPALNIFGDPILSGRTPFERYRSISRFYTQQVNDPAIRFLTDKGYYISDLPGNVTIPDEKYRGVKARRALTLGEEYEDVLTQSERYELQRRSGPEIKRLVLQYRQAYSRGPWNEKVQKKLSEGVSDIRMKYKRQVLLLGAAKNFSED